MEIETVISVIQAELRWRELVLENSKTSSSTLSLWDERCMKEDVIILKGIVHNLTCLNRWDGWKR